MDALTAMKQSLDALESNSPLWKVSNTIANLRTAIEEMENATAHPVPIPEGWQLVPVEPTDEMLADGFRNWHMNVFGVYQSMLAAAPILGAKE